MVVRPGQNARRSARSAAAPLARLARGLSGSLFGAALGAFGAVSAPGAPHDTALSRLGAGVVTGALAGARSAVRFLSLHTGLPALLVAAVLVAVGYRVLRRSARFALEVAAIAVALLTASHLGWIRW